jgi:hypothetical protein
MAGDAAAAAFTMPGSVLTMVVHSVVTAACHVASAGDDADTGERLGVEHVASSLSSPSKSGAIDDGSDPGSSSSGMEACTSTGRRSIRPRTCSTIVFARHSRRNDGSAPLPLVNAALPLTMSAPPLPDVWKAAIHPNSDPLGTLNSLSLSSSVGAARGSTRRKV